MEPSGGDKEVFNMQLTVALQNIKLGKQKEQEDLSEAALKHYAKAAETLLDLMRNEND